MATTANGYGARFEGGDNRTGVLSYHTAVTTPTYIAGSGGSFNGTNTGVFGTASAANSNGVYGTSTNASGTGGHFRGGTNSTGCLGATTGITAGYLAGSGGAFTGNSVGVTGNGITANSEGVMGLAELSTGPGQYYSDPDGAGGAFTVNLPGGTAVYGYVRNNNTAGTATEVGVMGVAENTAQDWGAIFYDDVWVNGTLYHNGIVNVSDARVKQNMTPIRSATDALANIATITYEYRNEIQNKVISRNGQYVGVIAQDVQKYFPELVKPIKGTNAIGVNYEGFIPYLIQAVQELNMLQNSAIEGYVTTDNNGTATVTLPQKFIENYKDYKYQLTVSGKFAQAIIAEEITSNTFTIKTSAPNTKVFYKISGTPDYQKLYQKMQDKVQTYQKLSFSEAELARILDIMTPDVKIKQMKNRTPNENQLQLVKEQPQQLQKKEMISDKR